jgi:ABC transporter substrate binding protein
VALANPPHWRASLRPAKRPIHNAQLGDQTERNRCGTPPRIPLIRANGELTGSFHFRNLCYIARWSGKRKRAAFGAHERNGGVVVTTSTRASAHRDLIVALAARHRLPAVYPFRFYVDRGGLISYGADWTDQYRRAAGYVDRILKGEKAADLPMQTPAKYDLVLNLRTASALGLTVPPSLRVRATEVIE